MHITADINRYHGCPRKSTGGSISRDITNGYGPEEYVPRKGMKGNYRIEANYYGRPNEERRAITLRMTQKQETVSIGEVTFGRK